MTARLCFSYTYISPLYTAVSVADVVLIRVSAIWKYVSSCSMPMKSRLVFTHATPVDPLPMQLSSTVPPSLVYVSIRYSSKATGFCVGCSCGKSFANSSRCVGYPVCVCMDGFFFLRYVSLLCATLITPPRWQFSQSLRVVCRLLAVKNRNIFNAPHRLYVGKNSACNIAFLPVPAVTEVFNITVNQSRGKRLRRKQYCRAVVF